MTEKPFNISANIKVLDGGNLVTPQVIGTTLPTSDNLNILGRSTCFMQHLSLLEHVYSIAASGLIEILSTLLTDEMEANIGILLIE